MGNEFVNLASAWPSRYVAASVAVIPSTKWLLTRTALLTARFLAIDNNAVEDASRNLALYSPLELYKMVRIAKGSMEGMRLHRAVPRQEALRAMGSRTMVARPIRIVSDGPAARQRQEEVVRGARRETQGL